MHKTIVFTIIVVLLMSTVAPARIRQVQRTQAGHVAGTATIGVYGVAAQNNTSTSGATQSAGQGVFFGRGGIGAGQGATQSSFSNVNNRSYTQAFLGAATTFFWGGATTAQAQEVWP